MNEYTVDSILRFYRSTRRHIVAMLTEEIITEKTTVKELIEICREKEKEYVQKTKS